MTPAEVMAIIRDGLVGIAALVTAIVAVWGIKQWNVELKGRTNFEIARGLMLATYRLRDRIREFRSPFIASQEFPEGYPGDGVLPAKQEGDAWAHVYRYRWAPVRDALQEFDTRALDAEALWGANIRKQTDALRQLVAELRAAIDAFLSNKYSGGGDFSQDREWGRQVRTKLSTSDAQSGNSLSEEIDAQINAIEAEVRPHLGHR